MSLDIGLDSVTFEFWIKRHNDLRGFVFSKSFSGMAWWRYYCDHSLDSSNIGKLRAILFVNGPGTGGDVLLTSNGTIPLNEWAHVALVINRAENMSWYINGEFDSSTDFSSHSAKNITTSYPFRIGVYTASDGSSVHTENPFNGVLSEFRYWREARTQEQIQACMNRRLTAEEIENGPLAGYWPLDDIVGGQALDHSDNEHHGNTEGNPQVVEINVE